MKLKKNVSGWVAVAGLVAAISFGSCKTRTAVDDGGALTVINFEEASENFRLTDSFKDISCVQLEMTDESVLGDIKKIIDAESNLIVLTKDNEIAVFNKENGKYLRHLGTVGEGPEEFLEAQDMFYESSDGVITIYDRMKGDFVSYRLNGDFVGKRKAEGISPWMESLERSSDGTMLLCNTLSGGNPPSEYAFTLLSPEGTSDNFDPFAPVVVEGFSTAFAERPMSVCGNELKLVKFMSDTVFSIEGGEVAPLFKLSLGNGIVPRKVAAEMNYGSEMISYSINNRKMPGINKMFETSGLMALIPTFETLFGYYWIDKESGKGYHVESANSVVAEVLPEMNKVAEGRTILNIVGSNEAEILSCVVDVESLIQAISENPGGKGLPEKVISTINGADPDGNPIIIIYSH